jgi:predicted Zn-ribbon and HTH transcriptional regulator
MGEIWKFECPDCGYSFQVDEPEKINKVFKRKTCPQCHGHNITKHRILADKNDGKS